MSDIAVIINKEAKNASEAKKYLDGFDKSGITYTQYETAAEQLNNIIEHCIKAHSIILIGGGDGSIRAAAHYCANKPITMGVLPLGTLNHFAKEMALPNSIDEMIDCLKNNRVTQIDLAQVNEHIFVNNSSIGFYPKLAIRRDHYSKYYNKWLSYIPSFIESLKKHKEFQMIVKSKYIDLSLRTSFLMVSNNIYSYEFPATIKRDSFKEQLLGLYYYKYGKIRLFKILRYLFSRNIFEIKESKHLIEIHFPHDKEIMISLDGETIQVNTPLRYQILPTSLTLLVNSSCE